MKTDCKVIKTNNMINKEIPSYLLGKNQVIGTMIFSIMFAIIFLNLYIPFSETAWFGLGRSATFFYTIAFISISVLLLVSSRVGLYYLNKHLHVSYLGYVVWCIGEILLICLIYTFMSTVVDIHGSMTQGEVFRKALTYCTIALGIPYFIAALYLANQNKNKIIKLMNYENVVTDEAPRTESELKKITLFDNNGMIKMSVSLDNLYFIQSDDNYVKIWYADNKGELQRYMLRCRLKTIEESFKGSGLIRCNRQHIVNMNKVGNLRKESGGYVLELDNPEIQPIAVTKVYVDAVLTYFA